MLRDDDSRVMIIDFGVARKPEETITQPRDVLRGSPPYAPCEQWHDPANVTPAADIYALGVTLFQLLVGCLPFVGADAVELMRLHCHAPRPKAIEARDEIPVEISDLIQQMMAIQAESRPSGIDVVKRLTIWRRSLAAQFAVLQRHASLLAILPNYIDVLESNTGGVGSMRGAATPVMKQLRGIPLGDAIELFKAAGEQLGDRPSETGGERGLLGLVQTPIEVQEFRTGVRYATEALKFFPTCFELCHFAGAAAFMTQTSSTEDREFFLREAIRFEEQAQSLPNAVERREYSASLATLAQAQHHLAMLRAGLQDELSRSALLQESLRRFQQSLVFSKPALRLANYAKALRDARLVDKALDAARQSCDAEWFIREGQEVFLELATSGSDRTIDTSDEHFRRWSLVEGEFEGDSSRFGFLRRYIEFLEQQQIWPELMVRVNEAGQQISPMLRARCRKAFQGSKKLRTRFPKGSERRLVCSVSVWSFGDAESFVVLGIPDLRTFVSGQGMDKAAVLIRDRIALLDEKLRCSKWKHPPFLDEHCRKWMENNVQ